MSLKMPFFWLAFVEESLLILFPRYKTSKVYLKTSKTIFIACSSSLGAIILLLSGSRMIFIPYLCHRRYCLEVQHVLTLSYYLVYKSWEGDEDGDPKTTQLPEISSQSGTVCDIADSKQYRYF